MPAIKLRGYNTQNPRRNTLEYKNKLIQKRYGLTYAEYVERLADQSFMCEICETPLWIEGKQTHLDHDHTTKQLRGFLCNRCNLALGLFKDDVKNVESAMLYLDKYQCI